MNINIELCREIITICTKEMQERRPGRNWKTPNTFTAENLATGEWIAATTDDDEPFRVALRMDSKGILPDCLVSVARIERGGAVGARGLTSQFEMALRSVGGHRCQIMDACH